MQPAKRLEYTADPNKFDLRTHVWDTQGNLVRVNHYRKFIMDGNSYYERPVNSGNLWDESNTPAGRVECEFNDKGHIVKKTFAFEAAHIEFTAPLRGAEKLHYELEQMRLKNAEIAAELAAIQKEREPAPKAAVTTEKPKPPSLKATGG